MEPQGFAKGQAARRKGVRRGHVLMNYPKTPRLHLNLFGFGGRACARESCWCPWDPATPTYQTYSTVCSAVFIFSDRQETGQKCNFLAFRSEMYIYHMVRGGSEIQTGIQGLNLTPKRLQIRAISWLSGSPLDSFKCEEGPVFRTAKHNNVNTLQLCISGYGGCVFASKIQFIQTEGAFIV